MSELLRSTRTLRSPRIPISPWRVSFDERKVERTSRETSIWGDLVRDEAGFADVDEENGAGSVKEGAGEC